MCVDIVYFVYNLISAAFSAMEFGKEIFVVGNIS